MSTFFAPSLIIAEGSSSLHRLFAIFYFLLCSEGAGHQNDRDRSSASNGLVFVFAAFFGAFLLPVRGSLPPFLFSIFYLF